MRHFFYLQDANSVGPVSEEEIHQLRHRGTVTDQTQVWTAGQTNWSALGDVVALPPRLPGLPLSAAASDPVAPTRRREPTLEPTTPRLEEPSIPVPAIDAPAGWHTAPGHPWRRYLARLIDLYSLGLAGYVMATIPVYALTQDVEAAEKFFTNGVVASVISQLILIPILAMLISTTGTTLGKWAMGIHVLSSRGERLTFGKAFVRELNVFGRGIGLGLPLITLIANVAAYNEMKRSGTTTWDRDLSVVVRYQDASTWRVVRALLALVVTATAFGLLVSSIDG